MNGGLELAVGDVFPTARTAWVSDIDPGPGRILASRFPDAPNLGDITTVDWTQVEPVDIITGGSPCFAAGTPVLTRRGLVPIEHVAVGDVVWTHRARWRPVTAVMTRIAPTVEFRPGFYSTPEHRLWLRDASRVWDNEARQYRRHLGSPDWVEAAASQGRFAATPVSVSGVPHDKPDTLTWWQVGRWLADGYTNGQVHVYLGRGKEEQASHFPGWTHHRQATALKLTMPRSARERDWLTEHFGHGAHGKTLPAFVLALPESDRQDVLDGYWSGDGHRVRTRAMRSVSVSPGLTVGIGLLAASLGHTVSTSYNRTPDTTVIEGRVVSQRDWWSVTATPDDGRYAERDADFLWQKLRKEPRLGPEQPVFDLTVADDESFVAAGIVVHNCQDLSHAGKRAGMKAGTRSGLWASMCDAIETIRPRLVIWENVRGALSAEGEPPTPEVLAADARARNLTNALDLVERKLHRAKREGKSAHVGYHERDRVRLVRARKRAVATARREHAQLVRALGRVVGDLADIGYDAAWTGLRAADVGAPHGRWRVFVLAWPADTTSEPGWLRDRDRGAPADSSDRADDQQRAREEPRRGGAGDGLTLLPTPAVNDMGAAYDVASWDAWTERMKTRHGNGNGHGSSLHIEALRLLPTPTVSDTNGSGAHGDGGLDLRTTVGLLPTPMATDSKSPGPADGARKSPQLRAVGALLPTPRATDGTKGGPGQRGSSGDLMLPSAVALPATPTAMDSRGSGGNPASSDVTLTDATVRGRGLIPRKETTDGHTTEAGPGEVLRELRNADDEEAVREAARGSDALPGAPDLLAELRQHEVDGREGHAPLAGAEVPSGSVRGVRDERAPARPPHRPEPREQLPVEPGDAVRVLPPAPALAGGPGEATRCIPSRWQQCRCATLWGGYAPAIHRWEMVLGRLAPAPTVPRGRGGAHRLSARAVEFMMGLPDGWVVDVDGVSDNEALKALGNGVVPQQAAAALRWLLGVRAEALQERAA